MRFHQSLDYVNNIHSLNSCVGDNINGNLSSNSSHSDHSSSSSSTSNNSTVKTFTSNGNHQALPILIDTQSLSHSQNEAENFNFLSNYRNDSSVRRNKLTIAALTRALSSSTTDENTEPDACIDDADANQNHDKGENSISYLNGNAVGECGDSSDLESNINCMITRGNLYKLNFDAAGTELELIERNLSGSIECLASSPDESFMEDDGKTFSRNFFPEHHNH